MLMRYVGGAVGHKSTFEATKGLLASAKEAFGVVDDAPLRIIYCMKILKMTTKKRKRGVPTQRKRKRWAMRMKKTVTHWSLKQRTKTMVRVGVGSQKMTVMKICWRILGRSWDLQCFRQPGNIPTIARYYYGLTCEIYHYNYITRKEFTYLVMPLRVYTWPGYCRKGLSLISTYQAAVNLAFQWPGQPTLVTTWLFWHFWWWKSLREVMRDLVSEEIKAGSP